MTAVPKVIHTDDGKGEWNSHYIYNEDLINNTFGKTIVSGEGFTKEEAYKNFVNKLDDFIKELVEFRNTLDINKTIKE